MIRTEPGKKRLVVRARYIPSRSGKQAHTVWDVLDITGSRPRRVGRPYTDRDAAYAKLANLTGVPQEVRP